MDLIDLPGIGEKTAATLRTHGIETAEALSHYYPRAYRTYYATSADKLPIGEYVSLIGTISRPVSHHTGHVSTQVATFKDDGGSLTLRWFNAPYIVRSLRVDTTYQVRGKVEIFAGKRQMVNPETHLITGESPQPSDQIVPVYTAIGTVKSGNLRKIIRSALDTPITDPLPPGILNRYNLTPLNSALHDIHFPPSRLHLEGAIHRLGFDELYALQMESLKSAEHTHPATNPIHCDMGILQNWITSLPFVPTTAQTRSIDEILKDLGKGVAMHRLLQGEVGSGKTLVAAAAALTVKLAGKQTLVMAPTQILAEQLHTSLTSFLQDAASISLVTHDVHGDTTADIVVGTQALLQEKHTFSTIGLVIVDEQHRFGVVQRLLLTRFAPAPHFLMMTATPIPRSLAMTNLTGLDVSHLDELPKNRVPVKTYYVTEEKRKNAFDWIKREIQSGNQAFVVAPVIDEAEDEEGNAKKSVTLLEKELTTLLPGISVDVMHGRMKEHEKTEHLRMFRDCHTQVLVATSMVEVGIDIPTANIMVIEDAERFGLAQLHQLRGRVGRGGAQGHCLLFSKMKSEKSRERLTYFVRETDGAKLAEYDLRTRGPGQLFGLVQHGFFSLRFASLFDERLLEETHAAALSVAKSSISP